MSRRIRLGRGKSAAFDDVARDDESSREEPACGTGGDGNYCGVDLVSTFFGHDFFRGEAPFRPSPSGWTEWMSGLTGPALRRVT